MADAFFVRSDADRIGARDRDEHLLAAHRALLARRLALVSAIGSERPALHVVRERDGENLFADAFRDRDVADRERGLDAPEEIARHPVAARYPHLGRASVGEAEDA